MSDNGWSTRDSLTAIVVVLIWGINFVPMKYGLEALTPFELGMTRYLFSILPLIFIIKIPKVRLRWIVITGLLQGVAQFSLLFIALEVGMTAALASVVLQTQIYFTALWSFLFYRLQPSKLMCLSMLAAGIGLIFFAISAMHETNVQTVTFIGLLFVLGSAAMWGAANLISRQAQFESPNYNALGFIVWSGLFALIGYILLMILFEPNASRWLSISTWTTLSSKTWGSVAYLGWASTLAGYALWTHLLKRHHANKVAPFSLGVPIVGLAAGLLWLKEPIDNWQWIGTFFVGISLTLVVFGPRWFRKWA